MYIQKQLIFPLPKKHNTCKPFGSGAGHLQFSTPFTLNVNILWTKKNNIRKYTTFCGGINENDERKFKKGIKYINRILSGTSVLYIGHMVPKG
jgi:hypothetical protein